MNLKKLSNLTNSSRIMLLGLVLLACLSAPTQVLAQDHGHHQDYGRRHHAPQRFRDHDGRRERRAHRDQRYEVQRHQDYGHYYHAGKHQAIPRHLNRKGRRHFKQYYYSRIYYPEHHHYHAVYRLPYRAHEGIAYRPYAYCDGNFFATGSFTIRGPLFDLSLRF